MISFLASLLSRRFHKVVLSVPLIRIWKLTAGGNSLDVNLVDSPWIFASEDPAGETSVPPSSLILGTGAAIGEVWVTDSAGTPGRQYNANGGLALPDSESLDFGTSADISMAWDGTRFNVTQLTANSEIRWGVSGAGIDQKWYGDTVGYDMTWDQTANSLIFEDSASVVFGTGSDIAITWNGTKLVVSQATANSAIDFGVDGAGIDMVLYGDTADAAVTWDQSANSLILSGVAKIKLQTIAAATGTAIPVTHSGSFPITTAAAETNTLADPTYLGQTMSLFADTYAVGNRVVTAASRLNQAGNTVMTFGAVGDYIKLEAITIAAALKWQVVANDGVALS